jgi:hypothetical protein
MKVAVTRKELAQQRVFPQCPIMGILLNSRPQLRLPLSIAAALLIFFTLAFVAPAPLRASNSASAVGVRGASPEAHAMPAKAVLQRVVHRKPVPYMPHAHVPEYLLCYVIETLECGHTVTVYPQADPLIAPRRRCAHCDDGKVIAIDAAKRPCVSVRSVNLDKKRA